MKSKRVLDLFGAFAGLVFLGLIFPFAALAVIFEDGRPVFVKLKRVSNGKVIGVYKFRSMRKGAEKEREKLLSSNERSDGPFFKMRADPRITRVGKILRRLRLDEFPQFINVLKGELSLVGPRPHEPEEMLRYPREFHKLFIAKGGLTGLSQINGRPYLPFLKELELDLKYLEKKSLVLDLKIIAKTLWVLISDPNGI